MILNLDLPYKKLASDTPKARDLSATIIRTCAAFKYKQKEMNRTESRVYSELLEKIEYTDLDEVELEKSEFLFLKDLIDKTDLPPMYSSWLWTFRDYIDGLEKKDEKKPVTDKHGLASV